MRIITGKYKGHKIKGSDIETTHPMSEKMRGAIFDILGPIDGLSLVDMYSGTGAVGIEALSRGAEFVEFVDKNRKAIKIIEGNLKKLSINNNVKITCKEVDKWVDESNSTEYNLIVADPPYDQVNDQLSNVLSKLIHKHLKPKGIVVLSHPGRTGVLDVDGAVVVKRRSFGNSALSFYRKE